jgi:hypothetical protein
MKWVKIGNFCVWIWLRMWMSLLCKQHRCVKTKVFNLFNLYLSRTFRWCIWTSRHIATFIYFNKIHFDSARGKWKNIFYLSGKIYYTLREICFNCWLLNKWIQSEMEAMRMMVQRRREWERASGKINKIGKFKRELVFSWITKFRRGKYSFRHKCAATVGGEVYMMSIFLLTTDKIIEKKNFEQAGCL